MKLEHTAYNIKDPVNWSAWYVANLRMKVIRNNVSPPHIHFLADEAGTSVIEVYHNPLAPVPDYAAMHPLSFHLAFEVDDLEAWHQKLLEAGATAEGEISTTPSGDGLVFLRDPWGLCLQLVKRQTALL